MSSIEERFARDIAAVTGGVVVTESELLEARKAVTDRIEGRRQHRRLRNLAVAAAAAVLVGAVGATAFLTLGGDDDPSGFAERSPGLSDAEVQYLSGSAPTAQLLAGVWRLDNGQTQLRFGENGTVQLDDRGRLFSAPRITGTYAIDSDLITMTFANDLQRKCAGSQLALRASLPEAGRLRFIRQGTSAACVPVPPSRGALEQLIPTSPVMSQFRNSTEPGWQALPSTNALYGVWLAEGGGHLLELDPGGGYYIADNSAQVVDQGQWSLRNAVLTLTSGAGSPDCSAGQRYVLGSLQWADFGTGSIRGTVQQNACGGAWTPAAWLQIPHVGS